MGNWEQYAQSGTDGGLEPEENGKDRPESAMQLYLQGGVSREIEDETEDAHEGEINLANISASQALTEPIKTGVKIATNTLLANAGMTVAEMLIEGANKYAEGDIPQPEQGKTLNEHLDQAKETGEKVKGAAKKGADGVSAVVEKGKKVAAGILGFYKIREY
ncbi:hypothetical protein ACFL1M_03825 [Patescibacteria group bacterium]